MALDYCAIVFGDFYHSCLEKEVWKMVRKCMNMIFLLLSAAGVMCMILLYVPRIFHVIPQIVLSGSMEPEIPVGSIVYIAQKIPPENIKERDIIAYQRGNQIQVLHRVLQVDEEKKAFQTKGDANEKADPGMVAFSQYRGKQVFSIPYLGYGADFLQKGYGRNWLLVGIVLLIVMDFLWNRRETDEERD